MVIPEKEATVPGTTLRGYCDPVSGLLSAVNAIDTDAMARPDKLGTDPMMVGGI